MPTILDYYKYAVLSTASYVRMGAGPYTGARLAELAPAQSGGRLPLVLGEKLFVRTDANPDVWTILHYHGGDVPATVDPIAAADKTGFAATLFARGGERVLAIRGVEPSVTVADAVRDLLGASVGGIGLLGVALNQLVDLVNLVHRLYGTGMVTQVRAELALRPSAAPGAIVVPLEGLAIPSPILGFPSVEALVYLSLSTYEAPGLGVLAEGERITLTGHSLGGHLAIAAAQLLGNRINPAVYVYNSAGFDPVSVDVIEAGASLVPYLGRAVTGLILGAKSALAESLGAGALLLAEGAQQASGSLLGALRSLLGSSPSAFTVHNLVSEDSVPGDDQSVVASLFTGLTRPGAERLVGTEQNSHAIEPLLDALALQALLYRLDNTLDLPRLKSFVDAAHSLPGKSEEALVEALHALLPSGSRFLDRRFALPISDAAAGLDVWVGKGNIEARNAFHAALLEINGHLDTLDLSATRVVSMMEEAGRPLSAQELAQRAADPDGYAYRYALQQLLPFAVFGVDYQRLHNSRGELELYDPARKDGGLTGDWIEDRARLLQAVLARNTRDIADPQIPVRLSGAGDTATEYHYYRGGKEEVFFAEPMERAPGPLRTQVILFADDAGRSLAGADFALGDRLYGGSGTDWLEGRAGDDYLEGGAGLDLYQYNAFSGLLGSGHDGADTILDADGRGVLRYSLTQGGLFTRRTQSTLIAGPGLQVSGLHWVSAEGRFTFLRSRDDLIVTLSGEAGGDRIEPGDGGKTVSVGSRAIVAASRGGAGGAA